MFMVTTMLLPGLSLIVLCMMRPTFLLYCLVRSIY